MKSQMIKICVLMFISISIVGCSNQTEKANAESTPTVKEISNEVAEVVSEVSKLSQDMDEAEKLPNGDVVGCGEAYIQGDMKYSVIGARLDEVDGSKYLVLKMEAYNDSAENYNFSAMMNLGMVNSNGQEGYLDIMYPHYEVDLLDGNILSGNKIIGEAAFDITEIQSDAYILKIGKMMVLSDAIEVTGSDIDVTYDAVFENGGVKSDFTVGDTVEFEGVSITFDGVRIEPVNTYDSNYDQPDMGLLVLDMTMENQSDEAIEFTSVGMFSTIRQVCAEDGSELEYEGYSYGNRFPVEPGETRSETFGLYYRTSDHNFYMTINPSVQEREKVKIGTFSLE
ncbi:hypothetical protein [Fusibacter ferrireducens]|uniref:DUF4352 domain-containing protein n=1 Tax=Fusibacter ferrireducens TaxID=2785058 RepID=A0ABR9ZTB5_9FIRM|nr:hypothetical protein [Fusibacter ferrireducens]MBF4693712.1 hypothetical protein [Fusibacter ferrireducens]